MEEKKYWKSLDESGAIAEQPTSIKDDHKSDLLELLSGNHLDKKSASRRDFLKWCGISFASATIVTACENPVKKAIPYIVQPEELIPGKATWYASSYLYGNEYCSILVKTRDGRPIKIEGNELSSISQGGTSARVQASVLSLYDDGARYKHPTDHEYELAWETADSEILEKLNQFQVNGRRMALVTPTLLSPATRQVIKDFQAKFPMLEVVTWDAVSYGAIRKAHQQTHNLSVLPDYRFDKADIIVSFSADFLGTWLAPSVFANRYSKTRKLNQDNPAMSHHVQFEANYSISGANADERIPVKPADELKILMALYNELEPGSINAPSVDFYDIKPLALKLKANRGKCIVISGQNNREVQVLVNAINQKLDSYGNTIDLSHAIQAGDDDEKGFEVLVGNMINGDVDAVMFYQVNPLYTYHDQAKLKEALTKAKLSISFASAKDETAEACNYIIPDNHYLESWNDAEFLTNHYSLAQPAISKIFDTRQFQDTLLKWSGSEQDFYSYLKKYWETNLFPKQTRFADFTTFWQHSLQSGVFEQALAEESFPEFDFSSVQQAATTLQRHISKSNNLEFNLIQNIAIGDGHDANNPWLQEVPDPLTSVTWDNFAAVSPALAKEKDLKTGDIIQINDVIELPVLVQPGQAAGCISFALGYGRTKAGKAGENIGKNAYPMTSWDGEHRQLTGTVTDLKKTGKGHQFALTQMHFNMEGRGIVRESTLAKYKEKPYAGNELKKYHDKHKSTLYPVTEFEGHHWALLIDLNACTGCSTCVVACQSENNVPVVGKDEVRRRRIMHWMRIDRYYDGESDNPNVVFQPVMCQHCDHAPCENVCPVAATNHSSEGLNQMAYNRCIGTKYCINNCPYKVRRFNWFRYAQNDKFDFNMNSDLGRMVLNPDVTVRERGVVEKCSFCVQRIQEAKLKAKNERRPFKDGDVTPACAQSCPSKALVFGDLNDPESRVAKMVKDPRNYQILEEWHTLPSVNYLTKIRNKQV
ncbi:MAG: Fe-S-cluster-containing hydrogenase [Bacteroidales bacterium]|nr:Fe-S-cluster-containing hydrogenase [Bacteroidales bacterium]